MKKLSTDLPFEKEKKKDSTFKKKERRHRDLFPFYAAGKSTSFSTTRVRGTFLVENNGGGGDCQTDVTAGESKGP